jgi:hypothetical protein
VCLHDSSDLSSTEYIIETTDVNGDFALFESLCEASIIQRTNTNRGFFLREFGHFDISSSILNHFHSYYPLGQIYDHFAQSSIPFIASKLRRLKSSELDNIPMSSLCDILSYNELKIFGGDSLYWWVSSQLS